MTIIGQSKSEDEIGILTKNFNEMISKINKLIEEICNSTKSVGESCMTLAANTEQTSNTIVDVSATVKNIA